MHPFLVLDVLQRAHHRGEPAFHVVGAAADQVVALDPGLELLIASRDNVEVTVQDHRRYALCGAWPDLRQEYWESVVVVINHFDVTGFEPALDESCGRNEIVRPRG